ncbi:THAP domain-containing protein 6, partial [Stegodyphus mimosarum]
MVICCVPDCRSDSWKLDSSVTFHEFPSDPNFAAKWIKQINNAVKAKPMWFPRANAVICSKHFLQTDFKPDSDALKPRCIPSVFGFRYFGPNAGTEDHSTSVQKSPLIVKVNKPVESTQANGNDTRIVNVYSNAENFQKFNQNATSCSKHVISVFNSSKQNVCHNSSFTKQITSCETTVNKNNSVMGIKCDQSARTNVGDKRLYDAKHSAKILPKRPRRREKYGGSDLIEIGPNTFLKINPDIIKVNKKQTPSGNTVLQFTMDQKLATGKPSDYLPQLIEGIQNPSLQQNEQASKISVPSSSVTNIQSPTEKAQKEASEKAPTIQHVLGHLVDTHICKESCADLKIMEDEDIQIIESKTNKEESAGSIVLNESGGKDSNACNKSADASMNDNYSTCIAKAPVLMTTNVPLSHCFMEKPKYLSQLKQKSRQIASLKYKITSLTKKIEELEDRCIVQERQLSYSFMKRLKTIRKNASKGDPSATYILEQIRGYSGKSKMRWSDSTLSQCAIWCKKAPYAYEYFKKADFFKLPCLGTVKRFMKKHPELKFQKKNDNSTNPDDEDSSSDFDFDENDSEDEGKENSEGGNCETETCETVLFVPSAANVLNEQPEQQETSDATKKLDNGKNIKNNEAIPENVPSDHITQTLQNDCSLENEHISDKTENMEKNNFPVTVDSSNLQVQEVILPRAEVILPTGEVFQCYSSNICNGDIGSQYYIIPNVGDQNSAVDHEYSVVQTDSLPVIIQNLENSQLPMQQEQLIFISNSSDQVECSETEVATA